MSRCLRNCALLWLALLLPGCRDGGSGLVGGVVLRDSAGVHIVLNTAPAWRRDSAWTVVDTPFFDVGGEANTTFRDIVGVVRTPAGALAVADGGDQRIRVFDGSGALIRILGARGSGPGEFQSLSWMVSSSDSLLAYDLVARRLTLFGADGKVRTAVLDAGSSLFAAPVARFHDGSLLVESGGPVFPFPGREGQVRRDSALLLRVDAEGHLRDTLAQVAWSESFGARLGAGDRHFMAPLPLPFARRASAATLRSGFVVGEGGDYAVNRFSAAGTEELSMRRNVSGAPVTPEAIQAFTEARRAAPAGGGMEGVLDSAMARALAGAPFPKVMPAFERILTDDAGNVWVLNYSIRGDQPKRWSVFSDAGRWLGDVTTPPRFDVRFIARDALYGVWRDAHETLHVRGYQLRKPR